MNIFVFGNFGGSNTGNESVLQTIVAHLRRRYPSARIICACSSPQTVRARYSIEALPFAKVAPRAWDNDAGAARNLWHAVVSATRELLEYPRTFALLRGADMLILPGTGGLTDVHSLFGWGPYNLFKWTLMARMRGARVLFISVGAGPVDTAPGRILIRASLALANYRSYRDESSRDCLRAIGAKTKNDAVYPDLAFSLPEEDLPAHPAEPRERPVVGLGLMEYYGKYSSANPQPETYETYLEALAKLAVSLIERGYEIWLLLGDEDTQAIEKFRAVLMPQLDSEQQSRIVEPACKSVPELLTALAATDLVVATRFHNVLLSLLLNRPTIAIAFHHKCTSLMQQLDVSEYCHDIHQMDAGHLIEQFQMLEQNREDVKRTISGRVSQKQAQLDEQYDNLFPAQH